MERNARHSPGSLVMRSTMLGFAFLGAATISPGGPVDRPVRRSAAPSSAAARATPSREGSVSSVPKEALLFVDTHDHIVDGASPPRGNERGDLAVDAAIRAMDTNGIRMALLLPMPQGIEQEHRLTLENLLPYAKKYPGRFAFLGGGENLNVLIQKSAASGRLTEEMIAEFDAAAAALVAKGVVGFGEMAAEHVSMKSDHPYVSAPPDHPLFLRLADLAARYGIPIDLHMEAIPSDMPLPPRLESKRNPKVLKANLPGFERLLEHNRKANIVWVHMGWDNTGQRTVELTRSHLARHPNLHVSLRVASSMQANRVASETFPLDRDGRVKPEWVEMIREFPDRFLIGSDEIVQAGNRHPSAGSIASTVGFLKQLPEELRNKVGFENARRLYRLKLE